MNINSERRIRNNRIRRRRQMRRNIIMCLFTFLLVVAFATIFFSFRTKAQSNDEELLYKYYKSVMVKEGDSLWRYAECYGNSLYYDSYEDYIKEVMDMNFLNDDKITSGQYLILPYYSPEFIPASNEPSDCLQSFGDCREGQKPRPLGHCKFDAPLLAAGFLTSASSGSSGHA